jgi:hypothetical protein
MMRWKVKTLSYVASSIVVPVSNSSSGGALGGLGSLASQFGGLASLAGVAVPYNLAVALLAVRSA